MGEDRASCARSARGMHARRASPVELVDLDAFSASGLKHGQEPLELLARASSRRRRCRAWSPSTKRRLMRFSRALASSSMGAARHIARSRVSKKLSCRDLDSRARFTPAAKIAAIAVGALGDLPSALRPVIDGVHRRHDREQHLRGADVARRLLAADVLLARLQRHAQRRLAAGVDRDADDAARHRRA